MKGGISVKLLPITPRSERNPRQSVYYSSGGKSNEWSPQKCLVANSKTNTTSFQNLCLFEKIEPNLERIRNKQKRHGATTAYLLIVCLSSNLGGSRSRATNACRSSATALASSSSAPPPSIPARPPLSNSFSCAQICQQIRK